MGVLYYVQREDDETEELFALNKVYTYAYGLLDYCDEFRSLPARDGFVMLFDDASWGHVVYERLLSWLHGKRLRVLSENEVFELVHVCLTYDEHRAKITGSVHDEDYDARGTYIFGSAW